MDIEKRKRINARILKVFLAFVVVIMLIAFLPETEEGKAKRLADDESKRIRGLHCLSKWDGSHREFISEVKWNLADPDSFEHVSTETSLVGKEGTHWIRMKFRARNSFGGMAFMLAQGEFRNDNCQHTLDEIVPL